MTSLNWVHFLLLRQRERDSPWVQGHVRRPSYTREALIDVEAALRDFTSWLQNTDLPDYDHAVAFTGYADKWTSQLNYT